MVNIKNFSKRLDIVMNYHQLSAAGFADTIQVGRSSISHILSGRNKPSLEFVMKIIEAFPNVDLYWLLDGSGTFPKSDKVTMRSTEEKQSNSQKTESIAATSTDDLFTPPVDRSSLPTDKELMHSNKETSASNRIIDKIIILYKDGSFDSYLSN